MRARPVNLQKVMVVSFTSNVSTRVIRSRDDEPHILTDEGSVSTQCSKLRFDPTISGIRYNPSEPWGEQAHCHNRAKQSDEFSRTDWRDSVTLPDQYSAYSEKLINRPTQFERRRVRARWFDLGRAAPNQTLQDGQPPNSLSPILPKS